MSIRFLQQPQACRATQIRAFDVAVDRDITVTRAFNMNGSLYNKAIIVSQATSAVTAVSALKNEHIRIDTQTFTTPHTTNNTTSFIVNDIITQPSGAYPNVSVNLQDYSGTTGLPIVTGKILSGQRYEITVINVGSQDLNGLLLINVDLTYYDIV